MNKEMDIKMFLKAKRIFAFLLLLTFMITPFGNISMASRDEAVQGSASKFVLSRKEVVKGNEIVLDYQSEEEAEAVLVYNTPSGNKKEVHLDYNEDSGMYSTAITPDEAGEWTIDTVLLNGNNVSSSSYELDFKVFESVKDQYGKEGPFIYDDAFQDEPKVLVSDLNQLISQVYGIDQQGNTTELTVRIQGSGVDEVFNVYNDGSSVITDENSSKYQPGSYTLTYSIEGGSDVVKTLHIVSDVADSNFVRLSGEEVSLSANTEVARVAGKNRYGTSVEISKNTYNKADSVVIANGTKFADALASSSLARNLKAPLLYAAGSKLNPEVKAEIKRLGAKNVYIMGGFAAVSREIEAELSREKLNIIRIFGGNRFETSIEIAKQVKKFKSQNKAILTNRDSFADALSAGAYSAQNSIPMFYTTKNKLEAKTKKYIKDSGVKEILVVGGAAVVSNNVVKELTSMGVNVKRIEGSNRYDTSIKFAQTYYNNPSTVVMASGMDFADALAGGVFAASKNASMVLASEKLSSAANRYVTASGVSSIYILGGEKAVSGSIFSALSSSETTTPQPAPAPVPQPKPQPTPKPNPSTEGKIKIMLDPGHGAGSKHNRGFIGGNEGDSNWAYHLILKEELERRGFIVGTTRPRKTDDPSLAARGQAGRGYDLLLSLHTNATGTKNLASGAEIYDDVNPRYSNKTLALKLGNAIARSQGIRMRGVFYRKLDNSTNWYGVLRNNEAKNGFLVEHCFHDNPTEIRNYVRNYRKVAVASANALAEYYGMK